MEEIDRVRLAKLLACTDSNHDGEALAAVRKANELLRRRRLSWENIVAPASAQRPNPRPASAPAAWPEDRDAREPWPRDPWHYDDFARGPSARDRGDSGIAAFAALLGSVLAFPVRRARVYRVAGSRRRRLLIALLGPLGVLAWLALCWAPPVAAVAYAVEATLPHPGPDRPALLGDRLRPSEFAMVGRRIAACWHQPEASKHLDARVTVDIAMNPDATVRAVALTRDPGQDPVVRRFAESAVAAVMDRRCQPLPLPVGRYAAWRTISLTFVSRPPP